MQRFYNHCKSDFDAEDWYENLEKNSPAAVASWSDLILHFWVKWLGATLDTLLEIQKPVTTTELDTATTIAYETSTTTTMNVNTTITTTTTIPVPANTAALAFYKTTTMLERPDRVADACCVIAMPTPIPAQLEAETTNASTDLSPSNIGATNTAVRQHKRTEKEPEVERVEMLKEEEKGGKKQKEMSEQEVGRRGVDTGEQEGIGTTQGEAQDPAPSPTTRTAANARLHKPTQSDWAAEVDEAMGLSPIAHNAPQPEPVNPVPNDATADPVRTTFVNVVPTIPIPIDPAPASTTNPVRTAPADPNPVPASPVPTESAPTNPVTVDPARTACTGAVPIDPVPVVNPIPGDVAVDPVRTACTTAIPVDPGPISPIPTKPAAANAVTVDPVRTAFANVVPADPVPVDPAPVSPINPVPGDMAIDPVHAALASTVPIDPVDHTHAMFVIAVPANPVSVDPRHVNPVLVTPADQNLIIFTTILVNLAFTTFRTSYSLAEWPKSFNSISLVHVRVFTVF